MFLHGKQCWLTSVHLMLNEVGLKTEDIKRPLSTWINKVKHTLQEIYISQWKKSLNKDSITVPNKGNKLRTYQKFKTTFVREPYLEIINNKKHRKSLARLRTSSHKLHIETGRYLKIDAKQRLCEMCQSGEV